MFDRLWTQASPVFDLPEDSDLPTPRVARILESITLGMTDDRIARSLGVGPRTVGREIAILKDTLGVNSRTEIVAAAAKRGWL
jgi:DNA-binding NarL/FixJ family response regulator